MKALVFSDLHLAHSYLDYALDFPAEAEIAVVAGDILAPVSSSLKWLRENVVARGLPTIFVSGNHEHYGCVYEESMSDGMADRGKYADLHWLENESVVVNGVRFLGCCLWTDFDLYETPAVSMHIARRSMNDYKVITSRNPKNNFGDFLPQDTLEIHQQSRLWLEGQLSNKFYGKTVVVTHHCPHAMSIAPRFRGDPSTPAFCSDLSDIIERYQPDAWVHGHTHTSFDYMAPGTKTRVICNPRGYVKELGWATEVENPAYEPFKVVDI
jgi:Icc-related predicted phosphoesterase